MGVMSALFGRKGSEEQRAIERWPWDVGGPPPYVPVDVDKALRLTPVFGAARFLADNIAAMPLRLYRTGPNGIAQRLPDPPLFQNPSVHGTMFDWIHRGVTSMALGGDACGYTTARDYYGTPTMVEWLDPNEVAVYDAMPSGPGSYSRPIWTWRGRKVNTEDLIHIPWFCRPYKIRGHSPISAFQLTVGIGLGAAEYANDWFGNGGVPPGVVTNSQQKISSEDAGTISRRIMQRIRTHQPLVLGNDWAYTPIAVKPHEAEFILTCQLTATQIAVMYGLPPEKLGGTTGNSLTYATVEQNSVDLLTFTLRPWLVRFEQAISNLFPRGTYARFDPSELLRMDALSKAQVDAISLGYYPPGWKSIPEVRAGNDLPPIEADKLPTPYNQPTPPPASTPDHAPPTSDGTKPPKPKQSMDAPPTPQQRQMQLLGRRWDSDGFYPSSMQPNTTRDRWLIPQDATNGNGRHPATAGA